jgi:hypothetical protein
LGAWKNRFTDEREVSARAVDFEVEFEDLQPAAAAMTIFNSGRDIPYSPPGEQGVDRPFCRLEQEHSCRGTL